MDALKVKDEVIYPLKTRHTYYDNLYLKTHSTSYANTYIMGNPFPKDEVIKLEMNIVKGKNCTVYLFEKQSATFTIKDTFNISDDDNDEYAEIDIAVKKGQYIGFCGYVMKAESGYARDNVWVYSSKITSGSTSIEITSEQNQKIFCVRISSDMNKYAHKLLRESHNYKNYPQSEDGYHFFKTYCNTEFANYSDTTSDFQDKVTISLINACLRLPKTYTANGKPTPIVMCAHGYSSVIGTSSGSNGTFDYRSSELVKNGYAVFDVDGYNSMGNPRQIESYANAYKYIVTHFNVEKELFVHGESMGGLVALNFANRYPYMVKAVSLFYPVIDLKEQAFEMSWTGSVSDNAKTVAMKYGFSDTTGETWESDKVAGYNPMENRTMVINDVRYTMFPCPIHICHGSADGIANGYAKKYIDAIKNCGIDASLRIVDGLGHATTDYMLREEVFFYNRYK